MQKSIKKVRLHKVNNFDRNNVTLKRGVKKNKLTREDIEEIVDIIEGVVALGFLIFSVLFAMFMI